MPVTVSGPYESSVESSKSIALHMKKLFNSGSSVSVAFSDQEPAYLIVRGDALLGLLDRVFRKVLCGA